MNPTIVFNMKEAFNSGKYGNTRSSFRKDKHMENILADKLNWGLAILCISIVLSV